MRRNRGRWGLIPATILAATLVFTASTALAKGPESVTLDGPEIEVPIELDTVDPGLVGRAMEQTGLWWSKASDRPRPFDDPPEEHGPGYIVTWIRYGDPVESVHERTIRQVIYPFVDEGVVIHNPIQEGFRHSPELVGWFEAPALGERWPSWVFQSLGASSMREAELPELAAEPASARHPADALPYLAVLCFGLVAGLAVVARSGRSAGGRSRA